MDEDQSDQPVEPAEDAGPADSTDGVEPAGSNNGGAAAPAKHRVRRAFVAVLVILGCVLAPLSLIAVWTRSTLLDTDQYVSTVGPLASNQDVQEAIATRVTAGVMAKTDIKARLKEALPPRAAGAAPAMTEAIEGVVYDAALKIVSSDQFANIWETANRRAHEQVVALLTGNSSSKVKIEDNVVILDLSDVAAKARAKMKSLGFDLSRVSGKKLDPTIELFRAPNASLVQSGIDALQTLAWVLPLLMLLCLGGAIGLSFNRRRTVLRSGLGVAAGMAIVLTALNLGRTPYLGLFPRPEGKKAGAAAYDQVLHDLRLEARAIFVLALLVALGAWLAGPSSGAVRLRGVFTGHERSKEPGAFATWVSDSRVGLRIGVIVLGVIALVVLNQPSGLTILFIAILVLVLIGVIEFVGRSTDVRTSNDSADKDSADNDSSEGPDSTDVPVA